MKQKSFFALILAIALVALSASASLAEVPSTADFFGDFLGDAWRSAALDGYIDTSHPSRQVGDVVYTMGDVIITGITGMDENGLAISDDQCAYVLATITAAPAEGTNIHLMPKSGYSTTDLWNEQDILSTPFDTIPGVIATAQEVSAATDAKVLNIWASINGLLDQNGSLLPGSVGFTCWKQPDGTLLISMEFMLETPVALQESYEMSVHIANWETTSEGKDLWEGHPKENWVFTIAPTKTEAN